MRGPSVIKPLRRTQSIDQAVTFGDGASKKRTAFAGGAIIYAITRRVDLAGRMLDRKIRLGHRFLDGGADREQRDGNQCQGECDEDLADIDAPERHFDLLLLCWSGEDDLIANLQRWKRGKCRAAAAGRSDALAGNGDAGRGTIGK